MTLSFKSPLLTIVLFIYMRCILAQVTDLNGEKQVMHSVQINASTNKDEITVEEVKRRKNESHELLERQHGPDESTEQPQSSVPVNAHLLDAKRKEKEQEVVQVKADESEQTRRREGEENESPESHKRGEERKGSATTNWTTTRRRTTTTKTPRIHLKTDKQKTEYRQEIPGAAPKQGDSSLSMQEQQLYEQINRPYAPGQGNMYINKPLVQGHMDMRQGTDRRMSPYFINSMDHTRERGKNVSPSNYRERISLHHANYYGGDGNGYKLNQLAPVTVTDNNSNDVGYGARSAAAQLERSIGVSGIYGRPSGRAAGSGHDVGGPRGYWDLNEDERQSKMANPLPWLINSGMRRATSSFNQLEASYNKNPQRKVLLKPLLDLVLNPSKR